VGYRYGVSDRKGADVTTITACGNCGRKGELRFRQDGTYFCRACGFDSRRD